MKQTNLNEKLVEMPELTHKDYDGTFDIKKSKAVAWMINQEVVMQYIWDKAVERKCIIFDCEKGTWKGVGNGFFDSEKQKDGRRIKMDSGVFEQRRVKEAAKSLGVTTRMIYRWAENATTWIIEDGFITYKKPDTFIDL